MGSPSCGRFDVKTRVEVLVSVRKGSATLYYCTVCGVWFCTILHDDGWRVVVDDITQAHAASQLGVPR
eukprot:scaffold13933_cov219-Amphora_coffeaeformis.AAC.12